MIIFEHVLQLEGLNRESVWRELEWLLRNPKLVLAGCDESSVQDTEISDGGRWLKRTKRFGDLVIEDQVALIPDSRAEIHVAAGPTWPRSWQIIRLEEAADKVLLTFSYEQENPQPSENPVFDKLRNEAYRNKDQALVDLIRQRAAQH